MINMSLATAAMLLNTTTDHPHTTFTGISIDTRTIQPGNLYIAILGTQLDGHHFIEEAKAKGASAILVSKETNSTLPQLRVNDTTLALGQLAAAWRKQFNLPIVAVTGSNGKTTVKNMIASIMVAASHCDHHQVLATHGTLNNHWGLPLTLAKLNNQHRYAAIEMGMNHFGEIEYLSQLTTPTVAIITNAANAHLEGVGDVAGVAKAKGEIFTGLSPNGIAILNRDDAFFGYWHEQIKQHAYLSFGFHPDADVTATVTDAKQTQRLELKTPKGMQTVQLPLLGKHNAANALAATAATLAIGIDLIAIQQGLESVQPAMGRLQLHKLAPGIQVIDDSYNANPFSLQAAINTLTNFDGTKILVLGDMRELGEEALAFHAAAGVAMRQAGIDYLLTLGELSAKATEAFGQGGQHFSEQVALIQSLKQLMKYPATVLIKGSRSMKMDKIVAELLAHPEAAKPKA